MDRITKAVERTRQEQDITLQPGESRIGHANDATEMCRVEVSQELLHQNRIFLGDEASDYAHAYKVLRTRVWHQMRSNGWHSLAVTSANPGEGKTLTAINLAISLARMEIGRKVILVDLDMRRPSVHRYLGFRPEYGVSDFLLSGMPLSTILVDIGVERFAVLPGCASFANSSEILSSGRMVQLLNELKRHFPSRLVIFDLPPMLAADDVLVVAPHINAFLLVIEEGKSSARDIAKTAELLKDSNIIGSVLNKTPEATQQNYGY
ncbi:MAG: CpsD/CapB family tyrosine-protein kinase [Gammaproteobacteria bacterium]|nr:CpsD/CapB family tyrosine-protein kinase [Gammaproteobacteria bacterium]